MGWAPPSTSQHCSFPKKLQTSKQSDGNSLAMHRMTGKVSHSPEWWFPTHLSPSMCRVLSWPLTVINDYPTEWTIDNFLVVAANASRSSAACKVCPCSWTCLWKLYLTPELGWKSWSLPPMLMPLQIIFISWYCFQSSSGWTCWLIIGWIQTWGDV